MTSTAKAMQTALDLFAASGVTITDDMRDALYAAQAEEYRKGALEVFDRKCVETADSSEWYDRAVSFASLMADEFIGENVGRGRGMVHERVFSIVTPHGKLKVSLTNEPEGSDES